MPPKKPDEKISFSKMKSFFFFGLIAIFGIALLYIFRPFFYPIFWAAVIAIMFYPAYKRFLQVLKSKTLTALLTLLVIVLIIFVPLSLISVLIINESLQLYNTVSKTGVFSIDLQNVSTWLENTPLQPYIENIQNQWTSYATEAARTVSQFIFSNLRSITQNSLQFIFMTFIMFYTLFYFLRDGDRILKRIMHLSPLGDKYETMLYERFTSTTRATLKGTLIVGIIQGVLGGLTFWITGIEGAFIWGVIMTALSIVPAIGSFLVWLPAGIIMLAIGNLWQGLVILLVGTFIISTIDNFIRPLLVGNDIQMHSLLVLFSTLGGLIFFGISGFVIGPIIAALFISTISIYDHYYKTELEHN